MNEDSEEINKLFFREKYQKIGLELESGDAKMILDCVQALRKDLSVEKNLPIQEVLDANIVKKLVGLLEDHYSDEIKFETVWTLTNIAVGESTETVIKEGACPKLIKLLSSNNPNLLERSIWTLGNIAGHNTQSRDYLLQIGVLTPLLKISSSKPNISLARILTWTIYNLTRGRPRPEFHKIFPLLTFYQEYINYNDEDVLEDLLLSISHFTDGPNNVIQTFLDVGLVPYIVPFLTSDKDSLVIPSLKIIGNIVTGNDLQTDFILNCGVLKYLKSLLKSSIKKAIIRDIFWTISSITAGNQKQIQHVINGGLFQELVTIAKNSSYEIKKEAIWAISNATSGGSLKQIQFIISCGALEILIGDYQDPKIINVCLEGIENILKKTFFDFNYYSSLLEEFESKGGVEYLESLKSNSKQQIDEKAISILKTYIIPCKETNSSDYAIFK